MIVAKQLKRWNAQEHYMLTSEQNCNLLQNKIFRKEKYILPKKRKHSGYKKPGIAD